MSTTTTQNEAGDRPGGIWSAPSTRIGFVVGAMVFYGIIMVVSAETSGATASGMRSVLLKRIAMVAVGGMGFAIGAILDYRLWQRHSFGLLALAFLLLGLVLVPGLGDAAHGARRWIRFGGIGFQPSEFAKFALIIWLAAYCAPRIRKDTMRNVTSGFLIPGAVVGSICLLILVEPDFGTSVLVACIGVGVLLLAGTRLLYVILAGLASLPFAYALVFNVSYRMRRITAFLHPWANARDAGYQLVQSLVALGSGGTVGQGLGSGSLGFLPAARNDFIFSVIGHQLGFVGSTVVILGFLWLMWEGVGVALRSDDHFGFLLATGISLLIGLQAAVHIAVVSGSVPTKGLSLPFISAGGSSLFFTLWGSGILINIALSEERPAQNDRDLKLDQLPMYEHVVRSIAHNVWSGLRSTANRQGGHRR